MEKFIREMKSAARSLTRTKGYTLTVIITLSACIAVNVAIFAIVNSVLLRPIPVPNAQQIVLMSSTSPLCRIRPSSALPIRPSLSMECRSKREE